MTGKKMFLARFALVTSLLGSAPGIEAQKLAAGAVTFQITQVKIVSRHRVDSTIDVGWSFDGPTSTFTPSLSVGYSDDARLRSAKRLGSVLRVGNEFKQSFSVPSHPSLNSDATLSSFDASVEARFPTDNSTITTEKTYTQPDPESSEVTQPPDGSPPNVAITRATAPVRCGPSQDCIIVNWSAKTSNTNIINAFVVKASLTYPCISTNPLTSAPKTVAGSESAASLSVFNTPGCSPNKTTVTLLTGFTRLAIRTVNKGGTF